MCEETDEESKCVREADGAQVQMGVKGWRGLRGECMFWRRRRKVVITCAGMRNEERCSRKRVEELSTRKAS